MANIDGLPVNSAVTHAEFVSRTENSSTTGIIAFNNTTDSADVSTGSIVVAGGVGVAKALNVGTDSNVVGNSNVGGELIVSGQTTLNDTLNASTILADGNITTIADVNAVNGFFSGGVTATLDVTTSTVNATDVNTTTLDASGAVSALSLTVTNDATINGNLTVNGTTTTLNTATVDSEDPNITVNKNGNDVSSEGAGFTVDRTGTKGSLQYANALASKFKIGDLASEAEIATVSHTQTLTNKTISGSSNTITNVSLSTGVTGTLPIANGGTGQTTQTAAFDALSPLTTKGDLVVNNGTNDVRLAVGTDAFVLTADSTQASGVKWAAASGGVGSPVVVSAVNNSAQVLSAATVTILTGWTESVDSDSIFNASTGVCTIPTGGGTFYFETDVTMTSPTSGDCLIGIYKNGTKAREAISPFNDAGSGQTTRHVSYLDSFSAGDTVDVRAFSTTSTTILNSNRTNLVIIKIK